MNQSKRYNMAWTAGFNAGMRLASELHLGQMSPENIQARAQELLELDAEHLAEIWRMEAQFVGKK